MATEITDKMVEAAFETFSLHSIWNKNAMRATLEAALAAREPADAGELVQRLRARPVYGSSHDYGRARDADCRAAATAIEELSAALRWYAEDGYNGDRARAALAAQEPRAAGTNLMTQKCTFTTKTIDNNLAGGNAAIAWCATHNLPPITADGRCTVGLLETAIADINQRLAAIEKALKGPTS